MAEEKALFYITEEWNSEKSRDELISIIDTVIDGNIVYELQDEELDGEGLATLFQIMRERPFSHMLVEYFRELNATVIAQHENIRKMRAVQLLTYQFLANEQTNKPKEVLNDYNKLFTEICKFFDMFLVHVVRHVSGQNVDEMSKEQITALQKFSMVKDTVQFQNTLNLLVYRLDDVEF
jgi:hypothetical protein